MQKKIYHKRGMQPQRKIIKSLDRRLHPEQVYTIIKLYYLDKLTIADIARQYEVHEKNIHNLFARERRRMEKNAPDDYTLRRKVYGLALRQLDADRTMSYRDVGAPLGLSAEVVKKIALRNGLGRGN